MVRRQSLDLSRSELVLYACTLLTAGIGFGIQGGLITPGPTLDQSITIAGFTTTISRANLRFVLTTIATAQASILAIVFSVTFLSVQLVSTNYTLRTLGQFSSSDLFSKAYLILGGSILVDILLLSLLPDPLTAAYLWWGVTAGVLFFVSVYSLQFAVDRTLTLSTPGGLAEFVAERVETTSAFETPTDSSTAATPTDPLHSVLNTAVQNQEWNTVEEVHDEYRSLVDDLLTAAINDVSGDPQRGIIQRIKSVFGPARIERDQATTLFDAVLTKEYESLLISTAESGNIEHHDSFTTDVEQIGVRCFESGLPAVGDTSHETLVNVSNPGDQVTHSPDTFSILLQARMSLLRAAIDNEYDALAHDYLRALNDDYRAFLDGAEGAAAKTPPNNLKTTLQQALLAELTQAITEMLKNRSPEALKFTASDTTTEETPSRTATIDALSNALLQTLRELHQEILKQGSNSEHDAVQESLCDAWVQLFSQAAADSHRDFITANLRALLKIERNNQSPTDYPGAFSDFSLTLLARISLAIGHDQVSQVITDGQAQITTGNSSVTGSPDRETPVSGARPVPGQVDIPDNFAATCQELVRQEFESLLFERRGIADVCDAFQSNHSAVLEDGYSVTSQLDDRTLLCEHEDGTPLIVFICKCIHESNCDEITAILGSIEDSTLGSRRTLNYRVLTCKQSADLGFEPDGNIQVQKCSFSTLFEHQPQRLEDYPKITHG